MRWQDWALIGTSLALVTVCAVYIVISSIVALAAGGGILGAVIGLSIGTVLLFLVSYFAIMLWRLRL